MKTKILKSIVLAMTAFTIQSHAVYPEQEHQLNSCTSQTHFYVFDTYYRQSRSACITNNNKMRVGGIGGQITDQGNSRYIHQNKNISYLGLRLLKDGTLVHVRRAYGSGEQQTLEVQTYDQNGLLEVKRRFISSDQLTSAQYSPAQSVNCSSSQTLETHGQFCIGLPIEKTIDDVNLNNIDRATGKLLDLWRNVTTARENEQFGSNSLPSMATTNIDKSFLVARVQGCFQDHKNLQGESTLPIVKYKSRDVERVINLNKTERQWACEGSPEFNKLYKKFAGADQDYQTIPELSAIYSQLGQTPEAPTATAQ